MDTNLFFGAAGDERGTPQDFFDQLNEEFHFELDCAASSLNHKCDTYFGQGGVAEDALTADWMGAVCFLNPPYSNVGDFLAKAREEADKGATVVCLLPVRSDTAWWHDRIWDEKAHHPMEDPVYQQIDIPDGWWRSGVRCRFLRGRLNFTLNVTDKQRRHVCTAIKNGIAIQSIVKQTGLPKMAIERIWEDYPDHELLDAAPFPSCVVIFEKER